MKMKKLTTIALAVAVAIGTFGFSVPAKAADNSTDYTITIPATLTVEQKGWNATDGITAQVKSGDTFDTSKTLTVTAASTNRWALKSGEKSVGYNLATAEAAYSASAQPASWDFSADELNASGGTNKAMGINVQDYTTMDIPAGSYTDTVTFTAKVEDNLVSFTIMRDVGRNSSGNYTVAPGTTWRQFIQSGNAPASVTMASNYGKVWHDINAVIFDCGGTFLANTADKKRVKLDDAIIDGATYGCSDYLGYQDHD